MSISALCSEDNIILRAEADVRLGFAASSVSRACATAADAYW